MINFLSRSLISSSHRAVEWSRRAAPASLRQFFRRTLAGRGVAAIENLAKRNAAASMRQQQLTMAAAGPDQADAYQRLFAANVADLLATVMNGFYRRLGVDPHSAPIVGALERFQSNVLAPTDRAGEAEDAAILLRFERAWRLHQHGGTDAALPLLEAIFRDVGARKAAARDPFVKEAVVRSGEILGRHHDTRGNLDLAIAVYQEVVGVAPEGVVARRLAVLLARRGELSQAARLAESVISSRPNLFPAVPENPYLTALKEELSR